MKKNILIFILAIIILGGAVVTVLFCRRNKYKDLCAYTENLLKIEWNSCIESATGDVKIEMGEEEWANIRLEVKRGYEEDMLNIVRDRFGKPLDLSHTIVPGYQGHEFATEIKNRDIQYLFETSLEGKRAKTRNIMIYVTYDEKGQMYIYIMG